MRRSLFAEWIRSEEFFGFSVYVLASSPLWCLLAVYLANRHLGIWKVLGALIFLVTAMFLPLTVFGVIDAMAKWRDRHRPPIRRALQGLFVAPFIMFALLDFAFGSVLVMHLVHPNYFARMPPIPNKVTALPSTTTTTFHFTYRTWQTIGPTARCWDGTYSYSANHSGTCSWHGGVSLWYR